MNTVVQGAWAVLLGVYGGADDVVFGVTSSGRGDQVEGMDSMVGLLINTTPARVRVDRGRPVAQWLRGLQEEQVRARRFEHLPLVAIQACSAVPAGQQLFTTLFAFENYPVRRWTGDGRGRAAACDVGGKSSAAEIRWLVVSLTPGGARDRPACMTRPALMMTRSSGWLGIW